MQRPTTPDELTPVSSLWEELSDKHSPESRESITEEEIAEHLFIDNLRVLTSLSSIEQSILFRAVNAADSWFEWMKRKQKTDGETFLRPRIRVGSNGNIEMSWVRISSTSKPAGSANGFKAPVGSYGRVFTIDTPTGKMSIKKWYQYLEKGKGDRYPQKHFKNEPLWAQKKAEELEDVFERLRKEQQAISAIRRSLRTIATLQKKQQSTECQEHIEQWGGKLLSLYQPHQTKLIEEETKE